jgi:class 3 adenylate cyclase
MSILSFVKTVADLRMSYEINEYNKNEEILARKPDFHVKMGYGLNLGWAIEGAIGSSLKIDASYLSPNVNMASRVEAATMHYNTDILLSDKLYKFCSP